MIEIKNKTAETVSRDDFKNETDFEGYISAYLTQLFNELYSSVGSSFDDRAETLQSILTHLIEIQIRYASLNQDIKVALLRHLKAY